MMAFALGSLGWTERQYYDTTLRGFINAQRGYNEEKKLQQQYLRRAAYIIHCSLVKDSANPSDLWPIEGEEKQIGSSNFEKLKQKYLEAQQRHGGTT